MEGSKGISNPQPNLLDNHAKPNVAELAPQFTYEELQGIIDEVDKAIYKIPIKERMAGEQVLVKALLERLLQQRERFKNVFTTGNGSTYFILSSGESFRIKKQEPIANWQGEYAIHPVTKRIFFIAPKEWERLELIIKKGRYKPYGQVDPAFNARKRIYDKLIGKQVSDEEYNKQEWINREGIQRLTGEPIALADLRPGVIPFEFDRVKWEEETIFEIQNNVLILMGHKTKTMDGGEHIWPDGPAATHYGHPVLEIIKG